MTQAGFVGWAIVGLIVAAILLVVFSPNARMRRRLKRTHGRIASKSRRPSVRFSVKPPKHRS